MESLRKKSLNGVLWSFFDSISNSLISLVIGIVLARLLAPEDFGLIAIVTVISTVALTLIDGGFATGLIRRKEIQLIDYSTILIFNLLVAFSLYICIYGLAPFIAHFFGKLELVRVIRFLCLTVIFDSIAIVYKVNLIRELNFKTQTKISFVAALVAGVFGVFLALNGVGVYSIVFSVVSRQFLICLFYVSSSSLKLKFAFSQNSFKNTFAFSYKILLTNLITVIQNNALYVLIGKYFSPAKLGFYSRAEQFNAVISSTLAGAFDKVFFPALSTIQDDSEKFKTAFTKINRVTFMVTYSAMILMAAMAKPIVILLLGDKWSESILMLQLLCVSSIFMPLSSIGLNVLKVKGRSDLILELQILKSVLVIVTLIIGFYHGVIVMLLFRILAVGLAYLINAIFTGNLIGYSLKEQISDINSYFFWLSLVGVATFSISFLDFKLLVLLSSQLIFSMVSIILIFETKKYQEYIEVKDMVLTMFKLKTL